MSRSRPAPVRNPTWLGQVMVHILIAATQASCWITTNRPPLPGGASPSRSRRHDRRASSRFIVLSSNEGHNDGLVDILVHSKSLDPTRTQQPSWTRSSYDPKRRDVLRKILAESSSGIVLGLVAQTPMAVAVAADLPVSTTAPAIPTFQQLVLQPPPPESANLPNGLLEARVTENVLSPPPYGMEATDIYYPSWFQGTWMVTSTTTDVVAPCGIALFGGNTTYQRARHEIGTSLTYASRFVPIQTDSNTAATTNPNLVRCIADREYNVRSIAQAAMGTNSVIDVGMVSPNQFACTLAPQGSPTWLNVDLMTTNRRQEYISDLQFDCSEVVRELVRPIPNSAMTADTDAPSSSSTTTQQPSSPPRILFKEVETTSLYLYDPIHDQIKCQQRSASFVIPTPNNAMSFQLWQYCQGKPIDVRMYKVVYERKR